MKEEPRDENPETNGNGRRGRIPWGLAGMFVLVVLVESFFSGHGDDYLPPPTASWVLSERDARVEAPKADLLILGDSLVKHGLVPSAVEGRSGLRAHNLSVCGAQPPATYYLFRRALNSGARPKAVVVDFKPDLLAGGPRYSTRNWPEVLTWGETFDLGLSYRDPGLLADTVLGKLLPTFKARFEVRQAVVAALEGRPNPVRDVTRIYLRQWSANRGAQVTPVNPGWNGHVTEAEHTLYQSHGFWCPKLNASYVRRFLDLATSRNIPVYWLIPPVAPETQAWRDQTGADARYSAFLRDIQRRYPGLVILDARRSGYDWDRFVDPVHLNRLGAAALSDEVAALVGHHSTSAPLAGHWVPLPSYRDRPSDGSLEDVDRSRLAVRDGGASRRR